MRFDGASSKRMPIPVCFGGAAAPAVPAVVARPVMARAVAVIAAAKRRAGLTRPPGGAPGVAAFGVGGSGRGRNGWRAWPGGGGATPSEGNLRSGDGLGHHGRV